MSLPYNKNLIPQARILRKNMTKQETQLWYNFLRAYPVRVQRQKVIDSYIADFYCHKAKLVIELDGNQHFTEDGLEYDKIRTNCLNAYGLEVLRFSNYDIDKNFESVCMKIDQVISNKLGIKAQVFKM